MFIANVKDKITVDVTIKRICGYSTRYGYVNVYVCHDDFDNIFVWKTSKTLCVYDDYNEVYYIKVRDKVRLTGVLKEHNTYKDEEQNVLTRCEYALIEKGPSKEEIDAIKAEEQKASVIASLDEIREVSYREYKEKYSDCETLCGSFHRNDYGRAFITVIIRDVNLRENYEKTN